MGFISTPMFTIFGVNPKFLLVQTQEEVKIKFGMDSSYALEEESGVKIFEGCEQVVWERIKGLCQVNRCIVDFLHSKYF